MESKKKLLLIENQQTQFEKIHGMLNEYQVYPELKKYEDFMRWVRIWVTRGYKKMRRDEAFKKITDYIKEAGIQLFILDYKICGNSDGHTGIYLADALKKDFEGVPILFLSRTPFNSKDLERERSLIKETSWVEKGYAGLNILEDYYFNKNVKAKLHELLNPDVEKEATRKKLILLGEKILFKQEYAPDYQLLYSQPIGDIETILIRELHDLVFGSAPPESSKVKELFSKYKKTKGL